MLLPEIGKPFLLVCGVIDEDDATVLSPCIVGHIALHDADEQRTRVEVDEEV